MTHEPEVPLLLLREKNVTCYREVQNEDNKSEGLEPHPLLFLTANTEDAPVCWRAPLERPDPRAWVAMIQQLLGPSRGNKDSQLPPVTAADSYQ